MAEAMKRDMDVCPDLETIAAYLDRRLPEQTRDAIAEHLASCEACYFVFTEAAQMRANMRVALEQPDEKIAVTSMSHGTMWKRLAWSAGGVLAAAAAVVLMLRTGGMPWRTIEAPELQALVAAVGTERMVEPRLSGGFAYGPMRAVRAAEPTGAIVSPDVRIAAAQIEKRAIDARSPQTLRALGVAYLVTGDVGRAVPVLEEAVDESAPDARTLNDLAAAYLVRAARTNQPQDLTKALATADRAVKLDGHLPEAWFNRAYALESLSLVDEARQAWQDYLKQDKSSGWADEAREHLRAIGVVPQSPRPGNERQP